MDPAKLAYILTQTQLPGMTLNETMLAQAWVQKHAAQYDDVQFQVYLGTSIVLGPGFSAATQRQAALSSQKRADMVATRGTVATIVEVKIRVSLAAMGQLLGYKVLWHVEFPQYTRINLVAIGNDALLDVVDLLHAHGIAVEIFPNVTLVKLPYG